MNNPPFEDLEVIEAIFSTEEFPREFELYISRLQSRRDAGGTLTQTQGVLLSVWNLNLCYLNADKVKTGLSRLLGSYKESAEAQQRRITELEQFKTRALEKLNLQQPCTE